MIIASGLPHRSKTPHPEGARPVRIQQLRRSGILFAHYGCDARQRQLQFFRLRRERDKQSVLRDARFCRLGGERDFKDGG